MIFKVTALREEIGDPLDMYSVNCDNSSVQPVFRKGGDKIRLLLYMGGEEFDLDLERCELVGGQIIR